MATGVLLAACSSDPTASGRASRPVPTPPPTTVATTDPGSDPTADGSGAGHRGDITLTIGDGTNLLGSDPERDQLADFWLTIDGPGTNKAEGNRHDTVRCSTAVYGCSAPAGAASGEDRRGIDADDPDEIANTEHRPDGTFVSIAVDPVADDAGDLEIQVFDPGFVGVGNDCTTGVPGPAELSELSEWYDDVERYEGGAGEWCTGDMPAGSRGDMVTTAIVREPDSTPDDRTDNPVTALCPPRSFDPHDPASGPTVAQLLHPHDGVADDQGVVDPDDGRDTVAETFRRWVTVCTIPADDVTPGEYLLQLRSNAGPDPLQADRSSRTMGHNRMSVRAVRTQGGTSSGAGIEVGGYDVALTGNDRGAAPGSVEIPFRSVPVTPGGTLELELFDLSDGLRDGAVAAELDVLGPDDEPLEGCEVHTDDAGPIPTSRSGCSMEYHIGQLSGRLLSIRAPAPAGCDPAPAGSCSLRVRLTSPTAASLHDTISFGSAIRGADRLEHGSAPIEPERPDDPRPERSITPPQ